jgi:hypothetical protein
MVRRKMLLSLAALLCILGLGMSTDSRTLTGTVPPAVLHTDCCADPSCVPGCCPDCPPDCCPLTAKAEGYTCPLTGEQLPCEKCCPPNNASPTLAAKAPRHDERPACAICP